LALGCKVTPRGSGYSSTQDNRDNLRPVLGRLVGLVVLAVMLDVAARRRSASACNCMKLIRCRHPALLETVKTSLTRRWRSACARGLFFLVIRDGSLTASIGTTEFKSWLSSEREMLEPACSTVLPFRSGLPQDPRADCNTSAIGVVEGRFNIFTWERCAVLCLSGINRTYRHSDHRIFNLS
jgi:predicted thioredoxin/glutaredoxin